MSNLSIMKFKKYASTRIKSVDLIILQMPNQMKQNFSDHYNGHMCEQKVTLAYVTSPGSSNRAVHLLTNF